ncbi:hypothetical protein J6590_006160 [Homalodisca vitripennis]|nr:hypothetical protein J6590_006160 [Homalodisca vitripennis]
MMKLSLLPDYGKEERINFKYDCLNRIECVCDRHSGGICMERLLVPARQLPISRSARPLSPRLSGNTHVMFQGTRETWLYVLDCFFSVFVIGTLVVFVWRGFWCLLDNYLFPDRPDLSAFGSLAILM